MLNHTRSVLDDIMKKVREIDTVCIQKGKVFIARPMHQSLVLPVAEDLCKKSVAGVLSVWHCIVQGKLQFHR